MFLLGSAALFVNPQLAYFHDGHLLLINKAETFHLKGKREWGGGVGAGIAANATCLGESLSGAELQCFLSPAAAGYQVDVGPLDVSISLFMRWCIPSRGARRLVYVAHFRAFAELAALVCRSLGKRKYLFVGRSSIVLFSVRSGPSHFSLKGVELVQGQFVYFSRSVLTQVKKPVLSRCTATASVTFNADGRVSQKYYVFTVGFLLI